MPWGQVRPSPWSRKARRSRQAGGPQNFIDRYSWDVSYEGQDASGGNWPPADSGVTLSGGALTTGQSTSVWSNLPGRMVDQAVSPNASQSLANALFDWQSNDFHFRVLLDLDATVTVNGRLFRYLVGGVRFAQIFVPSSLGTIWNFNVRNDADGGNYLVAVSGVPTGPLIIDWNVVGAQMSIFINGVDRSPAAHTGPVNFQNGPDQMDVLGIGASFILQGDYVFMGWRWNQAISLADHQADATEAGV